MQANAEHDEIKRAAAGDRVAMRALITRHSAPVYGLSFRMLSRAEDAEDVTQETFLRAWKVLPNWRPDARLSTWLHRVALNLCYDRLRKAKPVLFAEPPETIDPAPNPEIQLANQQNTARLQAAIGNLPPRQRAALSLCALEGHSNAQASEILDISVDALESLLARARKSLKTRLEEERNKP